MLKRRSAFRMHFGNWNLGDEVEIIVDRKGNKGKIGKIIEFKPVGWIAVMLKENGMIVNYRRKELKMRKEKVKKKSEMQKDPKQYK
jgi:hypothetical protein